MLVFTTHVLGSTEQPNGVDNVSQADMRKNNGRLRNGRGRTQSQGGRAGKSKGFPPNSFDRVLLDAPCSALGLRPRLFAGLVRKNPRLAQNICSNWE